MQAQVKILSDSWFSTVTSNENKSFGPVSINQFHSALKNVILNIVESELEIWIKTTGFFARFPPELVYRHNKEVFISFLSNYSPNINDFLTENQSFYLLQKTA